MRILRIRAKSRKTSIRFLSFVCCDVWENFPQTSLGLLIIQTLPSPLPMYSQLGALRAHSHSTVMLGSWMSQGNGITLGAVTASEQPARVSCAWK